ncbi:TIGR04076 family protein [Candidatus Bipolaricaulota bacterium]|nr:TIGR04076 family protein [Candidatus Bipolaricaulota bacterium]
MPVKITVVKKVVHNDLIDEYLHPSSKERGFGLCDAFEEGQEFIVKGKCPEGFCNWAWADIQRDVMMVAFGTGYPWVAQEQTAITCCTDGFRPVTFKLEHID